LKTLLLIGGTGFFGKSLNIYAQKRSLKKWNINKIINISRRRNQKINNKNLKIINIYSDIRKIKNIPEADFIIYAANTNNNKINLEGLKNFIKIIKKNNIKSNILFTSSGIVYGINNKNIKIKENQKINISKLTNLIGYKKNYSKTKFLMEKLLKELNLLNFKIVIG
jgi:dTDP-glucose 4,6-dehydratase